MVFRRQALFQIEELIRTFLLEKGQDQGGGQGGRVALTKALKLHRREVC